MKRVTVMISTLLMATIVLSACGQASTVPAEEHKVKVEDGSYRDITPVQLKDMLDNKDFLLINVHIPYAGEIPGTDLSIPYNQIGAKLPQLPENREAKIVLYCAMGPMSDIAAQTLVEQGYTEIKTLSGGMMAWERQDYELVRTSR